MGILMDMREEDKDLSSKESKSWIITESKDSGKTVNDQ
jgi:hypothetical protein